MKRIVVFAHYSKECIIDDNVIYYIKNLKKIADDIIFVSDSNVPEAELSKINFYIKHFIVGRHGEYDFGSYKRGFEYAISSNLLQECEELIFANDSCYAPLFDFDEMFSKMSAKNVDFWGNTANYNEKYGNFEHVQSYFMVFKKQVFTSQVFKDFISKITKLPERKDILTKYECGLTKILTDSNYKWDVYCNLSKKYNDSHVFFFKELIKNDRCPFLKKKIGVLCTESLCRLFNIYNFIDSYTDYDSNLMKRKNFLKPTSEFLITTWKIIKYPFIRMRLLNKNI